MNDQISAITYYWLHKRILQIVEILTPHLKKKNPVMRVTISFHERLAGVINTKTIGQISIKNKDIRPISQARHRLHVQTCHQSC